MSKPPDTRRAIRLADALDDETQRTVFLDMVYHEAADELRRLHASIERFKEGFQGSCYACEPVAECNLSQQKRIEELEGVMVRARNVLDAGVRISPESVLHDELRAALSKALTKQAPEMLDNGGKE
jgi:hypothetical protein